MSGRPRVLIIGAGIIGAAIAWHLARRGARVTVLDADAPGGTATRHSWAWINASWGNSEPYFRLRLRAMQEWHRLQQNLPDIDVAWTGSLLWELPPDQLDTFADEHTSWGYEIQRVGREQAQRIEPSLAEVPDLAVHAPAEGSVDPHAAALTLLRASQDLGMTVMAHHQARALCVSAGRVTGVETDIGRIDADEVVVAAGSGTAKLATTAGLDLAVTASPALLLRTRRYAGRLNGMIMPPGLQLRQMADGRLLAAIGVDQADPETDAVRQFAAAIEIIRAMLVSGAAIAADRQVVAERPMPGDGHPMVGRVDGIEGLYVAVMHSGITLAPAIGHFVADELLTGRRDSLLGPYRPDRPLCGTTRS